MNEVSQHGPLAELERRWGIDRSPQLTLHLAEEHRSLGNYERALEVLREGLEHHPRHIAARVALGRFLFEDGQTEEAIEALDSVVTDDPGHLVANKLLVSANVAAGNRERAGERLALYKTLNSSDADIEDLETAVAGEEEASPGSDLPVASAVAAAVRADPFGDLWSSSDEPSYRSALEGEGIFDLGGTVEEAESSAAEAVVADATVTLGRLYLDQGHREEAEGIFKAVLEREPDNVDAGTGLREATGGGGELAAADLLTAAQLDGSDPVERKRLLLESYRTRLRTASAKEQ